MDISARQEQIVMSLATGKKSLSQLGALSNLRDLTERTLQRDLGGLVNARLVKREGEARSTTYYVTPNGLLSITLSQPTLETIFTDEHRPQVAYDFTRLDLLRNTALFSHDEQMRLEGYAALFAKKLGAASPDIRRRERERITIDLSWKSSQLEGNTYSLLETESLIKEGIPGRGKTKEETMMILNHKRALDFTTSNRALFIGPLHPQTIIELHKILSRGLFQFNLRDKAVGITGSSYRPLETKYQLKEELARFCEAVTAKANVFEKALLAFTYLCYLQPFNDGNKRTGRILANALLDAYDSFPLSLRAIDTTTYKLALIAFYELGVLGNAKQLLIEQGQYAIEHYAP